MLLVLRVVCTLCLGGCMEMSCGSGCVSLREQRIPGADRRHFIPRQEMADAADTSPSLATALVPL